MFIVLSAEAVARREASGEKCRDVMPLACARGMVMSGVNVRFGFFGWDVGGTERGEAERERDGGSEGLYVCERERDLESERRPGAF